MRIARWEDGADVGEGFVIGDQLVSFPDGLRVAEVLAQGLPAARALFERVTDAVGGPAPDARAVPVSAVRLLAPVVPASVRDFVAFEEHVEGVSASVDGKSEVVPEWYQAPTFYFTNPHTILGPVDDVVPPETERLDFELELAAVIGMAPDVDGANLDADAAAAVIFGYTIMNDWSARDLQSREMKVRLGPAKGKDFGMSLGPWIVTADEFAALHDAEGFLQIRAEARIDGRLIGEDLVSNMGWPFAELIAYASRNSRVVPGDVLGSGTVGNGGCLGELWGRRGELDPPPLREGQTVSLSIEGIGELSTRVAAPVAAPAVPPARRRPRDRRREDA
jgi:2-keto-4-pentenoate hydratase/2-oxohepta-3-ene-1,7-dioic acid hydratase in catechol pathway